MAEKRSPHQRFGDLLRDFRNRCQMTQEQLAAAAGVTTTHVSLLENGHRSPSRGLIDRLSGALALDQEERRRLFLQAGLKPSSSDLTINRQHLAYRALRRLLSLPLKSDAFAAIKNELLQSISGPDRPGAGPLPARPNEVGALGYSHITPDAPRVHHRGQPAASDRALPAASRDELAAGISSLLMILVDPRVDSARRIALTKELISFSKWKLQGEVPETFRSSEKTARRRSRRRQSP
jgi:transcriptional regulator with XRE-family HTH domain